MSRARRPTLFAILWPSLLIIAAAATAVEPIWSLAICTSLTGIIVCWRYPRAVLFGSVLFTIFEETLLRSLPSLSRFAVEGLLLLTLLLIIGKQILLTGKLRYHRSPLTSWLLLFISIGLLSGWINQVSPIVTLLGMRPWLRYFVLFYAVTLLEWPQALQKRMVSLLLLTAFVQVVIGIAQFIGGDTIRQLFLAPDIQVAGEFIRSNSAERGSRFFVFGTLARFDRYGNFLALILVLLLNVRRTLSRQLPVRLLMILCAAGLVLSVSRQAWLGALIGIIAFVLRFRPKIWLWGLPVAAFTIGFIFLTFDLPLDVQVGEINFTERLVEPLTARYWRTDRVGTRVYSMAVVAPKLLQSAPWLGFGPGRYGSLVTRLYPTPVYTWLDLPQHYIDNYVLDVQWLTLIGQVGVLGTAAFAGIILQMATFARHQVRAPNQTEWGRQLAHTAYSWSWVLIAISFFGPNLEVRVVTILFWFFAALVCTNETAS